MIRKFIILFSLMLFTSCSTVPSRDRLLQTYADAREARDAGDNVQATLRFREVLRLSRKAKNKQ